MTGSKDTKIKCWAVAPRTQFDSQPLPSDVNAAVLLPDAKYLYLTHTNETYSLCRTDPFEEIARYPFSIPSSGALAPPLASAISSDRKLFVSATTNGFVVFDHTKAQLVAEFAMSRSDAVPKSAISGLAFSPDGQMLAGIANDRACRLWRIAYGKDGRPLVSEIASFAISAQAVKPPRFSRSGRLLGIALYGGAAEIWNIASAIASAENTKSNFQDSKAEKVATLFRDRWHFADIGFSRDDSIAVTASLSGRVTVWNLKTAREVAVLGGQLNSCYSVALSHDDSRLAACGGEGTVKLWETGTFQEVASLKIHGYPLYQLAFSSDDSLVVAANDRVFVLRAPKDNSRRSASE